MKMTSAFIIASVTFGLTQLTHAQCPELCDTNQNTAVGESTLLNNTGTGNTAAGFEALMNNSGSFNTSYGMQALASCLGNNNTAIGAFALTSYTTGHNNTAIGYQSLASNSTARDNTAVGNDSLTSNTIGSSDTAVGVSALYFNSSGQNNSAVGTSALYSNTGGHWNSAFGSSALQSNTTGNFNSAVGVDALKANTTGNANIALGRMAGTNLTTGSNNIDIGNGGVAGESNTIRIGATNRHGAAYIAGISGVTVPGGVGVFVDSSGHLGTTTSSARYKEGIKPMERASEAILSLKPVTFRYKKDLDPEGVPQFGLVAEDVEKVNPDLLARDADGKAYTVRYEAVNAMLLNEFLKEYRKVQEQETAITQLTSSAAKQEATIAKQQKQIEALSAGLQKVSAQLELSKPAPRTVGNDQ